MDQSEGQFVLCEMLEGIMSLTLNRPNRGNAWNGAMANQYFSLLEEGARSPEVRAIVVTGAGRAFCTGGDADKLDETASAGKAEKTVERPYWLPMRIGKPIVAAINGGCYGMGLLQALYCDVRIASEDARFATAYAKRGLVAEFGMSWLLSRVIGSGRAMDLLLSARTLDASEAERIGLVSQVVPAQGLRTAALEYASQLAQLCSPTAMHGIKHQVYRDLMGSFQESYDRSADMIALCLASGDFQEGVRSWIEKRPPAFPPLPDALALINLAQ